MESYGSLVFTGVGLTRALLCSHQSLGEGIGQLAADEWWAASLERFVPIPGVIHIIDFSTDAGPPAKFRTYNGRGSSPCQVTETIDPNISCVT